MLEEKGVIKLEELLKKSGLKITKQRMAILDILKNSELPTTAEDVFLGLKERGVAANLSTVYRTLETLHNCGIIKKFRIVGEGKAFYEFFRVVHRHFLVCIECKKMLPICGCPLSDYEKALEEKTDFKISGHKLDIYGYCPECRKKKK